MKERGIRPSVNRKTIDSFVVQKLTQSVSIAFIVNDYINMIDEIKDYLEISGVPKGPNNIKTS
jgi:hypothetical protein